MRRHGPHLPLRVRVALAFALVTAVALTVLGVFLHLMVSGTLEEQNTAALGARLDALERLAPEDQAAAVLDLSDESFGQLLDAAGSVVASSPGLRDPLLAPADRPEVGETATFERDVFLAAEGAGGPAIVQARRSDAGTLVVGTATEDTEEVLANLRTQLLVGGPAALLLASGLGYVVAGAALRPMERMRTHAATISSRSSGERLPLPEAQDEVHRLGRTLNDMLDRLDAGLRQQRQFVAEASHELRTPLALLRTELDLVRSRARSPEELRAFLDSASEEVDRLTVLVDQLLLLATADESGLDLERAPVDLDALLDEVAARYAPMAGSRVSSRASGTRVVAPGDRQRLDQVVSNLVDNALRHGVGDVVLEASNEDGHAVVTVTDQGGVTLADELFERFRRGDGSRVGGRGLGLALVRAIVTEHGGTVRGASENGLTRVRIELPLR